MIGRTKKGKVLKSPADPLPESIKRRGVGMFGSGPPPAIAQEFRASAIELLAQCKTALNYGERMNPGEFEFLEQLVQQDLDGIPDSRLGIDLQHAREVVTRILGTKRTASPDQADRELLGRLQECLHQIHSRDRDYDLAGRLIKQASFASDEDRSEAQRIVDVYGDFSRDATPAKPTNGKAARNGKHAEPSPAAAAVPAWGPVFEVELKLLDRHPDNREPTESDIAERAASLEKDGQLEPLRIRELPKGRYQILSGETRVLAGRRLGLQKMEARAIACDDAQALIFLADFNGHRTDLNPIQKARLILKLCEPREKGGSGLTREEAGAKVGIESVGGVSNLVRLLELPKPWQDRVYSGELPQSFAREMLPVLELPGAMKDLEQDWKERDDDRFGKMPFASREGLSHEVESLIERYTRRLDAKNWRPQKHDPALGYGSWPIKIPKAIIEANREQLRFRTFTFHEGWGKQRKAVTLDVATNCELFDKLQLAAVKESIKKQADKRRSSDGDEKPAKREVLTPAQLKAKAKEAAEQLQRRIDHWRHEWLGKLIAQNLEEHPRVTVVLLAWMAANGLPRFEQSYCALESLASGEAIKRGAKKSPRIKSRPGVYYGGKDELLGTLVSIDTEPQAWGVAIAMVRQILCKEERQAAQTRIPHEHLDLLASHCGIDVAAAWNALQRQQSPILDAFYSLHSRSQLAELAKELKVSLDGCRNKDEDVTRLLDQEDLPLPKSIKPLATAKPAKCLELPAKKGKA